MPVSRSAVGDVWPKPKPPTTYMLPDNLVASIIATIIVGLATWRASVTRRVETFLQNLAIGFGTTIAAAFMAQVAHEATPSTQTSWQKRFENAFTTFIESIARQGILIISATSVLLGAGLISRKSASQV